MKLLILLVSIAVSELESWRRNVRAKRKLFIICLNKSSDPLFLVVKHQLGRKLSEQLIEHKFIGRMLAGTGSERAVNKMKPTSARNMKDSVKRE